MKVFSLEGFIGLLIIFNYYLFLNGVVSVLFLGNLIMVLLLSIVVDSNKIGYKLKRVVSFFLMPFSFTLILHFMLHDRLLDYGCRFYRPRGLTTHSACLNVNYHFLTFLLPLVIISAIPALAIYFRALFQYVNFSKDKAGLYLKSIKMFLVLNLFNAIISYVIAGVLLTIGSTYDFSFSSVQFSEVLSDLIMFYIMNLIVFVLFMIARKVLVVDDIEEILLKLPTG